eukprot:TRINITY_DN147_c0_g1_i1.p1 TRINITY_DN147_c0_g1~~TRINITY_DN147_c0_g1_i1.p1  ORF type:complete len:1057 (-),score=341.13 TRINITY_DN147_c0_g1_i1:2149-5319(-)
MQLVIEICGRTIEKFQVMVARAMLLPYKKRHIALFPLTFIATNGLRLAEGYEKFSGPQNCSSRVDMIDMLLDAIVPLLDTSHVGLVFETGKNISYLLTQHEDSVSRNTWAVAVVRAYLKLLSNDSVAAYKHYLLQEMTLFVHMLEDDKLATVLRLLEPVRQLPDLSIRFYCLQLLMQALVHTTIRTAIKNGGKNGGGSSFSLTANVQSSSAASSIMLQFCASDVVKELISDSFGKQNSFREEIIYTLASILLDFAADKPQVATIFDAHYKSRLAGPFHRNVNSPWVEICLDFMERFPKVVIWDTGNRAYTVNAFFTLLATVCTVVGKAARKLHRDAQQETQNDTQDQDSDTTVNLGTTILDMSAGVTDPSSSSSSSSSSSAGPTTSTPLTPLSNPIDVSNEILTSRVEALQERLHKLLGTLVHYCYTIENASVRTRLLCLAAQHMLFDTKDRVAEGVKLVEKLEYSLLLTDKFWGMQLEATRLTEETGLLGNHVLHSLDRVSLPDTNLLLHAVMILALRCPQLQSPIQGLLKKAMRSPHADVIMKDTSRRINAHLVHLDLLEQQVSSGEGAKLRESLMAHHMSSDFPPMFEELEIEKHSSAETVYATLAYQRGYDILFHQKKSQLQEKSLMVITNYVPMNSKQENVRPSPAVNRLMSTSQKLYEAPSTLEKYTRTVQERWSVSQVLTGSSDPVSLTLSHYHEASTRTVHVRVLVENITAFEIYDLRVGVQLEGKVYSAGQQTQLKRVIEELKPKSRQEWIVSLTVDAFENNTVGVQITFGVLDDSEIFTQPQSSGFGSSEPEDTEEMDDNMGYGGGAMFDGGGGGGGSNEVDSTRYKSRVQLHALPYRLHLMDFLLPLPLSTSLFLMQWNLMTCSQRVSGSLREGSTFEDLKYAISLKPFAQVNERLYCNGRNFQLSCAAKTWFGESLLIVVFGGLHEESGRSHYRLEIRGSTTQSVFVVVEHLFDFIKDLTYGVLENHAIDDSRGMDGNEMDDTLSHSMNSSVLGLEAHQAQDMLLDANGETLIENKAVEHFGQLDTQANVIQRWKEIRKKVLAE